MMVRPAPTSDEVRRRLEERGWRPLELDQPPPRYLVDAAEVFRGVDGVWQVWVPGWWGPGEASGLVWCLRPGDVPIIEVVRDGDEPQLLVKDRAGVLQMRLMTQPAVDIWREGLRQDSKE